MFFSKYRSETIVQLHIKVSREVGTNLGPAFLKFEQSNKSTKNKIMRNIIFEVNILRAGSWVSKYLGEKVAGGLCRPAHPK